jgi:sortase B
VNSVNSQASGFYDDLSSLAIKSQGSDGTDKTIDWGILDAENAKTAAWIYQPGTQIDYPVIAAGDYSFYLTHLSDGVTENPNGSPFLDFNSSPDFSDALTVIYGNSVSTKAMFSSLNSYKDQSYFDQHPYVYLYTQQGNYRLSLKYGATVAAGQWRQRAFMNSQNITALLNYAQVNTTFTSDVTYTADSQWVALATCSSSKGIDGEHYVVLGVLEPLKS